MYLFSYKFKVGYKGSNYLGWQVQKDSQKTIQGQINNALKLLSKGEVKTLASGRTDAGVHALGQIFKGQIICKINPDALIRGMNSILPNDIKIFECDFCDKDFHPIRDSLWKEYHYFFTNNIENNPFLNSTISNYSYSLDLLQMQKACSLFEGEHDFANFYSLGSEVLTTVKTILSCSIEHNLADNSNPYTPGPYYVLKIRGSGFLKQMVRMIMGGVWLVGRNSLDLNKLKKAIDNSDSGKVSFVAPANGLFLNEVKYPQL